MKKALKDFWAILKLIATRPLPDVTGDSSLAVLDSDLRARSLGYGIVAFLLLGFGGWAVVAPLESAAIGSGVVQVEGDSKPVQHLEGGIVAAILVDSGDYVTKDQALLRLDSTQFKAERSILQGRLQAKKATIDRLIAERDEKSSIEFAEKLTAVADDHAKMAMASEEALFEARRADRLGEVAVLEQRIMQLEEQAEGGRAVVRAKESVAASLTLEISELTELLVDGYVDKQRIRELDRSLTQVLGEVADLNAKIAGAKVAIEETQLSIAQLNKRFVYEVIDELAKTQEELFDYQQRYTFAADKVRRATVRAPTSGYVMALAPKSVGAVIGSAEPLMEIVPDAEKFVIDVQMSPMDIDRIRIGQEAEVKFSVFKDSYSITGELVKISADAIMDERTGASYYKATVELMDEDIELLAGEELVPGMPASVLVKTGSRTLIGYLTSPLQRMFEKSLTED